MRDRTEHVEHSQGQAVAAWVAHLNQLRLDALVQRLREQTGNLEEALATVDAAMRKIDIEIVAKNRGATKGMHGFIAEIAEVGVGNARAQVIGEDAVHRWVNDNSPVDLLRDGVAIQQKFSASGGWFSLRAVEQHLDKYPDYIRNGGRYQIPADHYETVRTLHTMAPTDAGRLVTSGDSGPSFTDWQRVQEFFATSDVSIESLEPSTFDYRDVQRGVYDRTLDAERDSLRATDRTRRDDALAASRPTLRQGVAATAVASAVEGGTAFVLGVVRKRRAGKRIADFTDDDWTEIAAESGTGFLTGAVRGASVYALTNLTATPAAVASAMVTSGLGIAALANRLRGGEVTEAEFIEGAELICLESAISALSSVAGQAVVPIPVLGAVIGTTVGTVMYQSVSSSLAQREAALIDRYRAEQRALEHQLAGEHQRLLEQLRSTTSMYLAVLERAFSPDIDVALQGSIELAVHVGVARDHVLDTEDKTWAYFTE